MGPTQEPAPTGAAAVDYEDRGGRYDQAYLARKMQADDMKNAKAFLQYKALSASSLEKFDRWKDDILKATRSVDLSGPTHWSTINRLIGTRMEHNIYQAVEDLFPEDSVELGRLDPTTLLTQIEARLITSDQLEYKRIQFELAKQKESKSLWQFENRLYYLQKEAKIDDDARFVETYKKGVFNNKLRETLMLKDPPITMKEGLKAALTTAQVGMLKYTKNFYQPTSISHGRTGVTAER